MLIIETLYSGSQSKYPLTALKSDHKIKKTSLKSVPQLQTESTRRKRRTFMRLFQKTKRKMRIKINTGILNTFIISVL